MDESRDGIKQYEISFLAKEEADVKHGLDLLRRHGAEITLEGPVERITLAYPVSHETGAHFGYVHFAMAAGDLPSFTHDLRASRAFIRFLVVTPPFHKAAPRQAPRPRIREAAGAPAMPPERQSTLPLSNEALEKKIEEILKE